MSDGLLDLAYSHYEGLRIFLASYLQTQIKNTPSNQRTSAREKLTRLTKPQFADMSTDVFDEMKRRQTDSTEVPFLPVRDDYHPKRNQARQKLATLPSNRFKDLASDVYYEIERRFPTVVQQYQDNYGDDGTIGAIRTSQTSEYKASEDRYKSNEYKSSDERYKSNRSSNHSNSTHDKLEQSSATKTGLDQLMQNLGNIINNPTINQNDLINRIKELELEKKQDKQLIEDLKNQLQLQAQETKDMDALLDKLTREHKKLKEDYQNLQEDYNSQQAIANDIRQEAANLLNEIKALSKKNEELMAQNRQLGGEQVVEQKTLSQDLIDAFYNAIDNLILAGRGDTPSNVLVAMKAVVIASKNITQDTETIEHDFSYEDREDISNVKNKLSASLGQLMQQAKGYATVKSENSSEYLEEAASDLTGVVEELITIIKSCTNTNVNQTSIQELKIYLEKQTDQIVQAIQNLLYAMRQSSTYGKEFQQTIQGITSIVDNLISRTRKTFASKQANVSNEMKSEGEAILNDLKNANYSLEDLGNSMVNDPNSKQLKQKLASSSYEIAKFVKELISLIE